MEVDKVNADGVASWCRQHTAGGVLGPGDSGDDSGQELDGESEDERLLYLHHLEDMWCKTVGDRSKWRDGSRQ